MKHFRSNKGFQATAHKLSLCDRLRTLQSYTVLPVGRRLNPDVRQMKMKRKCIFAILLPLLAGCVGTDRPLHDAVSCGDIQAVETLVDGGANINAKGMYGRTPLYYAALCGQSEAVAYLLAKGANPKIGASWKDNNTPLHVAAEHGDLACVQILVNNGVPVDIRNSSKQTPLLLAAEFLHPTIVKYLLDHGAKVDAPDRKGNTPLYWSTCSGEGYATSDEAGVSVVQILLEHGANPNVKGVRGTPLAWAVNGGHHEIEKSLREHGAKE